MNTKNSQKSLFIWIALCGLILAFAGCLIVKSTHPQNTIPVWTGSIDNKNLTITVISDKRCSSCMTEAIVGQIQQVPFLKNAHFVTKDFSESGIDTFLKDNKIAFLPALIFSSNKIVGGDEMLPFLWALPSGQFNLALGSKFDPFAKRSEAWFLLLDKKELENIKKDSYISGNTWAILTWLEYSDIECPYCVKFHKAGTMEKLKARYSSEIASIFQHFPLPMHKNALPWAQLLECAGKVGGEKIFTQLMSHIYAAEKSDQKFILSEATTLGLDAKELEACLASDTYKEKILNEQTRGEKLFAISSTPSSVLINNETGEYEIVGGAMPEEVFVKVIDRLLGK
jgi:predicted DsbA family dithiol-disulfide isomerase